MTFKQLLVSKVLPIDGAVMAVPMERFRQSFIEIEVNLHTGPADGVLNELRPPRIDSAFPVNPRRSQMRAIRDRRHRVS